ncbi:MAG: KH domain-containing protein [Patescibacteria group bacterium]|jgi:hypothetical protein|nr:KH domain-containing protein [Patescibacteria group bacterium]
MNSIDEQFLVFVVKSLVSKPDEVKVARSIDERGVLLELTVNPEDLGRVIGKRGATAQSIRTLLRALGTKNDARYNLKIVDNGESRDYSSSNREQNSSSEQNVSDQEVDQSLDSSSQETSAKNEEEESSSDRLTKTRQELNDLDDLDI